MAFDPIGLALEISDVASFERAVLEELARTIGFDAAFFAVKGAASTTVNVDAAALDRAIARFAYESEIAPTKTAALAARGVAIDTEVLGERAVRSLGYYRHFAAPIGGRHSLLAFPSLRGRPIGALMLGRTPRSFSLAEVAAIESLLPALAIARASFAAVWRGAPLRTPRASTLERARDWLGGATVREQIDNPLSSIVVRDRNGFREMVATDVAGELVWSRAALKEPDRSGWFYVDLFHLAAVRAHARQRALFIGCGGGIALRQFAQAYPGIGLDVVESERCVIDLARRWFSLDEIPNLTIAIDDGASYLARAPSATWDAIVIDAYDGTELPPSLASKDFFGDVGRCLRPGGGFAFNVIDSLAGHGPLHELEARARGTFADVRLVPVIDPGEAYSSTARRNVILLGRLDTV